MKKKLLLGSFSFAISLVLAPFLSMAHPVPEMILISFIFGTLIAIVLVEKIQGDNISWLSIFVSFLFAILFFIYVDNFMKLVFPQNNIRNYILSIFELLVIISCYFIFKRIFRKILDKIKGGSFN